MGDLFGLNLTYATLAATLKYPNLGAKDKGGYIGVHKHGVFYTEKEALDEIITECKLISDNGSICRHPLAFLMEAADSICYYIMDVEDAIQKQWIKYEDLEEGIQKLDNEDLYNRFFSKKDNIKYTKKKWVDLRTKLITYLMELATKEFINNLDSIIKGTYDNELIEND